AAVQDLVAAPSPVSETVASPEGAAVPCWALTLRDDGDTLIASGTGIAVITRVSITRAGEPLAPLAVTLMVSTYTPGVSPEVLRVQETVPLPVPLAVVSVVQLFFLAALHDLVD